jgi:acylglycerol lipase
VIHGEGQLTGVGGVRLFRQSWQPDDPARGVIVISHGAGEHSSRYGHVAARLVNEGFAVYALDHRGHGRSAGPRALVDRIENTVADLDSLIVLAGAEHAGAQVFLLGHSMGGTIALRYAMVHQDRLAGLILSGPLAELEATSPATRFAARLLSSLAPRLPVVGVDPSLVSRDPAEVDAYRNDPLVHHGKLPARTVWELALAIDSFPEGVRSITVPTLIMYGTDDRLCPPTGSVMLDERISSEDKTLKSYEGLYHEILNEPERDRVMDDLCSWLEARVRAVPA